MKAEKKKKKRKKTHTAQRKLATVNTIDVAGRFHYNTLLFQLMTNSFSKNRTGWREWRPGEEARQRAGAAPPVSRRGRGAGGGKWENVCPVDGKEVLDAAMIGLRNGHVVRTRRRSSGESRRSPCDSTSGSASVKFRLPMRREARSGASAVKGKQNHDSPCDSQGFFFFFHHMWCRVLIIYGWVFFFCLFVESVALSFSE